MEKNGAAPKKFFWHSEERPARIPETLHNRRPLRRKSGIMWSHCVFCTGKTCGQSRKHIGCCVNLLKKEGLSNKPSPSPPVGNPLVGISSGVSVPPCFIGNPAYGGIMRNRRLSFTSERIRGHQRPIPTFTPTSPQGCRPSAPTCLAYARR